MASTVTELLRRRFGGKKEVDPYADWIKLYCNTTVQRNMNLTHPNITEQKYTHVVVDGVEIPYNGTNNYGTMSIGEHTLCLYPNSSSSPTYMGYYVRPFRVIIPNWLTYIGDYAEHPNNIQEVICLAVTPPTTTKWSFYNPTGVTLYVPDSSVSAYQSATNWSSFGSIKPLSQWAGI